MLNDILDDFIEFDFITKLITIISFSCILWFGVIGINGAIDALEKEGKMNIDIKRAAIINQSQQIYSAILLYQITNDESINHLHTLVERDILSSVPVFEDETWKINEGEVSLFIKNRPLCETINKRLNNPIEKWDVHLKCNRITDDLSKVFILKK